VTASTFAEQEMSDLLEDDPESPVQAKNKMQEADKRPAEKNFLFTILLPFSEVKLEKLAYMQL